MADDLREARTVEYQAWDARMTAERALLAMAMHLGAPSVVPWPFGAEDDRDSLVNLAGAYVNAWVEWDGASQRLNALDDRAEADAPRI